MRKEIFSYFEMAAKLTKEKKDQRAFLLGACAVRKDGTLVSSINSMSILPEASAHAEFRVSRKTDVGAVVYVARVRLLNGNFAMARPCKSCEKVMISRGISKVFYTMNETGSYGVMDFDKDKEYQVIKVR